LKEVKKMKKLVLVAIVLIALLFSTSLCFAQTTLIFATQGQKTIGTGETIVAQFDTSPYNAMRVYFYCRSTGTFNIYLKAVENNITEWILDTITCSGGQSITRQYFTPAKTIRIVTFMYAGITGSLSILAYGSK